MREGVRFSVVIPCYNEAGYLTDTLLSLHKQDFNGEYEIIVVDNNCTDATADIARGLGVRVVSEPVLGVTNARQRGTEAAIGEIVISADADTSYAKDWLSKIDANFRKDPAVVAVVGPCRYVDGPRWGMWYARALFGLVNAGYRLTGRTFYATATNIAFRHSEWTGYDVNLTQGGDELDQLRRLRRRGKITYDNSNPTFTSGRRLKHGLVYNLFGTLIVHYFGAYFINRIAGRRVLGGAPAFRDDR